MDIRDTKLSNLLISYSTEIKPGEKVLIEYEGVCAYPWSKL